MQGIRARVGKAREFLLYSFARSSNQNRAPQISYMRRMEMSLETYGSVVELSNS